MPSASAARSPQERTASLERGKEIYTTTCVVCHGESGQGGSHGGAKLTRGLTPETVTTVVSYGRHDMPAFGSALNPDALQALTDYVLDLASRASP